MNDQSRRNFLKFAGIAAVANAIPGSRSSASVGSAVAPKSKIPFELGIASYTFRAFQLDQVISMTQRLGIKRLTLKDMHLPMKTTKLEFKAVREKMSAAGLQLASCGVVYMQTEAEIESAFAYAKLAGIKMMVGVPNQQLIGVAEHFVKETNIALAIHNHGPTDQRYPSPESAYKLIADRDERLGLCIDVGHTQRLGLDPAREAERFLDRLFDIHMKDVSSADAKGTTVEIGRGVIDIVELLRTLRRLNYAGTLHFEHEKDEQDPLPGLAESVGYVRGVLASI
jgi:inosose dehydratase